MDTQPSVPNRYALFEHLLSFLEAEPSSLNPVLAGYFAKLVLILLQNKAGDVYRYVYGHPGVLDNLVRHLNQKSLCEIL
jgi:hypothetical protein